MCVGGGGGGERGMVRLVAMLIHTSEGVIPIPLSKNLAAGIHVNLHKSSSILTYFYYHI